MSFVLYLAAVLALGGFGTVVVWVYCSILDLKDYNKAMQDEIAELRSEVRRLKELVRIYDGL